MGRLGVLLAGGRGRRLGLGIPKALLTLSGATLLDRGVASLAAVCDRVVVAAPAAMDLPVDPVLRVHDPPGAEGPLAGMVAGLLAEPFESAIVLGVDFPLAAPAVLARLAEALAGATAAIPVPGGIPQPLVAAYAPDAVPPLTQALAAGERAPTRAVLRLGARFLDDAWIAQLPGGARAFANLNRPVDLAEIERWLAEPVPGSGA